MYKFIDCNRGRYSIEMMAEMLCISPRSYYDYKRGRSIFRAERKEKIEQLIQRTYAAAKGRYGAPRIAAEISANDFYISQTTVSKYMKEMGLRSKLASKYKNRDVAQKFDLRIAPNHLNRAFNPESVGMVWVSDITYIETLQGLRYLTTVMDLYDCKIIGWSLSSTMKAEDTTVRAYKLALKNRAPETGLIFHSDQGVQYACREFRGVLGSNVVQSMSRRGNCWDNAVAESFFKSLKGELIYGNRTMSVTELESKVFEYIEIFYNRIRRHSALKNMSIIEFWNINAAA